ncbi:hypothetical protein GCM10007989_38670 [Devosia pacifica]|uniref:Uncharacterized protein n=1 Tax=Devosia pacifica TaxID=1335967 RepID=A0A918SH75_9HYPH|nr:extracellular solute-binding protein [Devosia pacifica]GHA39249.1 hypothetical protein GCM10007989_38670 [Devosia pacifica]
MEPTTPEGPYEAQPDSVAHEQSGAALLEIVDFIETLRNHRDRNLGLEARDLGIVLHLVRNHLTGRLTTMSSLATASGLSYGTAFRSIEAMIATGLIVKREKTATGKSYSLHPSSDLLKRWQRFAGVVRGAAAGMHHQASPQIQRTPESELARIIPAPTVLARKLVLPRGLRLLVHADPTFMAMNALKRQFEMILGLPIQSRALSIDRLRDEIVRNSERSASAYDIVACDLPWFGEMVSEGRLRPLDDLITKSSMDVADFLPDAVISARRRGAQYGVPLLSTAELLVYRRDLLAAAGVEPPRTTAETLAAARAVHRPEEGRYGIAWNAARGTALGHTFIVLMAAHGQPIVNLAPIADGFAAEDVTAEHLHAMFASEAAVAAADYLRELLSVSPPGILTMTWYDRARAYASGQTGLAYAHTLLAHLFERDPKSPAHGQTGYLPQPSGLGARPISPLGGYALAIPANLTAARVEPVWAALEMLTSREAAKLYITHGSLASPRHSVNRDPEVRAISPLISMVDEIARAGILRAWPRPPVPGISGLITIAGEEIHAMLSGHKSRDRALKDAQMRADAAMRQRNAYGGP